MGTERTYRCRICGFHYRDKKTADECHAWCSSHKSCSMEITKHSIELGAK